MYARNCQALLMDYLINPQQSFAVITMVMSAPVLQIMKLKQRSLSKVIHLLSGRIVEHCRMVKWDENLEGK